MIDIEFELFDYLAEQTRARFPGVFITGEYVKSPSSFPCVSILEVDNSVLRETQTGSSNENHVNVMYEINVYSNKTRGRKSECKAICAFVDNLLIGLNFSRILLEPVPNMDDATIYRMLGRYRAVVSKNKTIYRR